MERYFSLSQGPLRIPCKIYEPDFGAPKRCILGVHGFGGSKDADILTSLSEEMSIFGSASVCFDFPAHGESPMESDALTLDNCIETLNNWISLLSQMFPDSDKAEIVEKRSNEMYDMVQERVKDIPDEERANAFFLFQYSDTTLLTSGQQFFGQWWADAIGAKNVATELSTDNSVAVNMEQVYSWNPDLIFMTNFNTYYPDDLYNNTVEGYDWSAVKAVQDKRVFKMPLGMYRSYTPGVDCPVTLLWMAKAAYPEKFEDVDVIAEAKDYYKEVFGIDLSDEQAQSIFEPVQSAGGGFSYQ